MTSLLLIHLCLSFAMTGVIWIVQLVHYPSFKYVEREKFKAFSDFHVKAISFIVMPLMIVELITAYLLVQDSASNFTLTNLFLVGLTWLCTFALSMPLHKKLAHGFNLDYINRLVSTNWPRTIIWTLRSSILLYCIINQGGS